MSSPPESESFSEFRKSFGYGRRTDLNFKFLKNIYDEEAAAFLQSVLWKLGDLLNDGDIEPLIDHIRAGQGLAYDKPTNWSYDEGPFSPLKKSPAESHLALLTSSGHFVAGDDPRPFGVDDMSQEEAIARINDFLRIEPRLSIIPVDTPEAQLRVRHGGYDVRGARVDPNVVFPLKPLRELAAAGRIGSLASNAYSFTGACAQTPLRDQKAPQWAAQLKEEAIEAVVLVPV